MKQTERNPIGPVAIIGKGMIGISLAVLFTGNGIATTVLAKNSAVGLEKYRTIFTGFFAIVTSYTQSGILYSGILPVFAGRLSASLWKVCGKMKST